MTRRVLSWGWLLIALSISICATAFLLAIVSLKAAGAQEGEAPATFFGFGSIEGQLVEAWTTDPTDGVCGSAVVQAGGGWSMEIPADAPCQNLGPGSLLQLTWDGTPSRSIVFWYPGATPSIGIGNTWPAEGVYFLPQRPDAETRLGMLESHIGRLDAELGVAREALAGAGARLDALEQRVGDVEAGLQQVAAGGPGVEELRGEVAAIRSALTDASIALDLTAP